MLFFWEGERRAEISMMHETSAQQQNELKWTVEDLLKYSKY